MKKTQLTIGWPLINVLDWANNSKDAEAIARRCIKLVGEDGWKDLSKFVDAKVGELQKTIEKYEDDNGKLGIGSDDGFSDVTYHVVGLGQQEFNRCMANPALVEKRYNAPYGSPEGYQESFAYVFLRPSKERTEQDTKEDLEKVLTQAGDLIKRIISIGDSVETAYKDLAQLADTIAVVKKDLANKNNS